MWITPQPSFARLPGIDDRSSSSSPSLPRPSVRSRTPSVDLIKSKSSKAKPKKKSKGKAKESPDSSSSSSQPKPNKENMSPSDHYHGLATPPLPHEEDAGPSGFGVANDDFNTLTEEYLEAASKIGYDGRVKDVANEGPLVEGSNAWEEAQHAEEEHVDPVKTPDWVPVDGTAEFHNPWNASEAEGK